MDYLSIDPTTRRLYIANMGEGSMLVVDLQQEKLVAVKTDLPKITGVLAVPELHKIYASVTGSGFGATLGKLGLGSGKGQVAIFSSDDLHEIARLPGGTFPDGIAFDPGSHKIFVSDEKGSGVIVIDGDKDQVIRTIDLGGEVGNVRFDPLTAKIYAPIQSRNELAYIDPKSLQVLMRNPLTGCEHPHGLFIAPSQAIGYVACDGNGRLLVVDLKLGVILDQLPLGRDPDVLDADAATNRLYVAGESGYLYGFDISDPAKPVALGSERIGDNAHSVAVDPATHKLYFPIANQDDSAVLKILDPPSF